MSCKKEKEDSKTAAKREKKGRREERKRQKMGNTEGKKKNKALLTNNRYWGLSRNRTGATPHEKGAKNPHHWRVLHRRKKETGSSKPVRRLLRKTSNPRPRENSPLRKRRGTRRQPHNYYPPEQEIG